MKRGRESHALVVFTRSSSSTTRAISESRSPHIDRSFMFADPPGRCEGATASVRVLGRTDGARREGATRTDGASVVDDHELGVNV